MENNGVQIRVQRVSSYHIIDLIFLYFGTLKTSFRVGGLQNTRNLPYTK